MNDVATTTVWRTERAEQDESPLDHPDQLPLDPPETVAAFGPTLVVAPHQDDELLTALSPLLDEVDGLRGDDALHQGTDNVGVLLEENARLRKLAVKLSNLLGDLPEQGT